MERLSVDDRSPRAMPAGPATWSLRDVPMRRLLAQQDFGSWVATVAICVGLIIAQAMLGGPRERPFSITDATLAFPVMDSTISTALDIGLSLALAAVSILVAELWLARGVAHADLTAALAAVLHFVVDAISAFFVCGLTTAVTKKVVGRFRPNFLALCQPATPNPNPPGVTYGLPPSSNSACTAPDSSELTDAHYRKVHGPVAGFPSGHASTAFSLCMWAAAYCMWAFYVRVQQPSAAHVACMGLRQRVALEARGAAGLAWLFALFAWAWAVGVSRITDYKHHPSDVIAGAFLGTLIGGGYALRAVCRLGRVVPVVDASAGSGGACTPGPADDRFLLLHNGSSRVHAAAGGSSVV